MKVKVFHVITHLELGGAQKNTLMTLEQLSRDRYELGLVSSKQGLLVDWANRIPAITRVWVPALVREVRPVKDLIALVRMWRLFRRERPALVHTHCPKAGILGRWAARLAGVPVIVHTSHGFGFTDFQRPVVRNFFIWIERLTAKITTQQVFVSYQNAQLAERLGLARRGEWIVSRSGIDLDAFLHGARGTKRAEWGVPEGKLVVGMIAAFKHQKAPTDFVDLAARVLQKNDRVHFVMAGDGELREAIEGRIRHHGIERSFTLLGWQPVEEMPAVYRSLDVLVLTSLWEGLPRVFPEAMASELPIVATDVDGGREAVIDGETGYLFAPHDVEGMAAAVLRLLEDPELRQTLAANGRRRVEEFDAKTAFACLESQYRKCLERI